VKRHSNILTKGYYSSKP